MNRPDFAQTATGGAHITTHKQEDGSWIAKTDVPGMPAAQALRESEAITIMSQRVHTYLNQGQPELE